MRDDCENCLHRKVCWMIDKRKLFDAELPKPDENFKAESLCNEFTTKFDALREQAYQQTTSTSTSARFGDKS